MKTPLILSLSTGILMLSTALNSHDPLSALLFTPIAFITLAILICIVDKELKSVEKSVILGTAFIIHDMAIMIYSGINHDHQILSWSFIIFIISAIPAYGVLISGLLKQNETKTESKWTAALLFPLAMSAYWILF